MSTWKIYRTVSGAAQEIAECVSLEFHDIWMGEEFVTVSIVSPTPIELQVGDYLTYRGAAYSIYSLPAALKQARSSSYGEAFKYDNVKLSARSTELTDIRFLDIVLGDNNLHYTSLPTFSVYCETVDDLVDRLQANTDRNGIQWFFITPSYSRTMQRYTGAAAVTAEALWHQYYDNADNPSQGNTEINISVDKMSVWDGLAFIKNNFGLNFITRDRACVIGAPGVIADHIFRYGKGNGLYEIERTADTDQQIVTKLFAYGSDKNLPLRYYATIGDDMPNNMAVNVLMLPGFPQYSLSQLCRLTYYTDGTGSRHTKVQIRKTPSASYSDIMDILGEYTIGFSDNKLRPYITSGNVSTLGVKEGDIHFTEENDDNGLQEVYPSIEGMTAGDAGVSGLPADERLDEIVSISNLDGTKAYIDDNGVFEEGAEIPNFYIYLKPLGFNLKEAYDANGGTMVIHLNDGYCGGREFAVKDVIANGTGWKLNVERSHDESLDLYFPYSWAAATGGTPSANEAYQIRTGDHFVLTEIEISDTSYIWAASVKALRKAITWLLNNDYTRFTYLPKVDEIFMARQHDSSTPGTSLHDTLKAGDVMNFEDSDLDIAGNVFIDTLTIKENGNNGIPTYDVVLRNDKQVGTMQRIQNQLNTLSSFVTGGGGGLSIAQIRQLIQTYGAGLFLSKLNDDTAQGFIRMLKGIQVGSVFDSGILGSGGVFRKDADGTTYIEADRLYIRMKAYFDSVEVREYIHSGGNRIASPAQGFKCSRVDWIDANGNVLEQINSNLPNVEKFRCYWRVDDGETKTDNQFVIGDLAFCQNAKVTNTSLNTKRFWRVVVDRDNGNDYDSDNPDSHSLTEEGEAWIDISNAHNSDSTPKMTTITWAGQGGIPQSMSVLSFQAGSDIPSAEDDICMLGDVRDITRQGAIIEYTSGEDSPSYKIYQGIGSDPTNPYSLEDKNYLGLGYDSSTGRAYLKVYGDARIGAREGESGGYIKYNQQYRTLEVNGRLNVGSTLADGRNVNALGTSNGNLLLNTSFTGDYDSEDVTSNTDVTPDTVIYSDPLKHWQATGVTVIALSDSQSGYAAKIAGDGTLAQTVSLEVGKWYVLSFRGRGGSLSYSIGGVTGSLTLNMSAIDSYDVPFLCGINSGLTILASSEVTIMELQLCEGNLPTAWKQNYSDGEKTMAAVNEYKYISDAIKNASTDIIGGLILSQIIKVGNYRNKQMTEETGGMSGAWLDDNSPFLWGGGDMSQAIYTIMKYANDPSYEPTQEEIEAMAKFVVTHGGRAILNDVILRGYIYALGGYFKGKITAESGDIGGFDIGEDNLSNKNYDAGISIQDAQNNPNKLVQIGNEATDTLTGRKAAMVAKATESNTGSDRPYNTALFLEAKNATYNYAFHGSGNGVLDGFVAGFRTQDITIPSGTGNVTSTRIVIRKGSMVVIKGSHTSGWVNVGMPVLSEVQNTLGIDSSTEFFFEVTIISYSSYEYVNIAFRGASGQSGNDYPVLMDFDDRPRTDGITQVTSLQIAQGDYMKVLLTYKKKTDGVLDYRAYVISNLN